MSKEPEGSVTIEERIEAPAATVAAFIGDFRNAKEWMVGVENVEKLAEEDYRLTLDSPVGKIEPAVKMLEHSLQTIRWTYTSTIEGGGRVDIAPTGERTCAVTYTGAFELKSRLLGTLARAAGMNHFAHKNGERSLSRLKHLMEARRYA